MAAAPELPVIAAELYSFPTGSVPAGFDPAGHNSSASVGIWNDADGAVISSATVNMNGITLTYDPTDQMYEGSLDVAPGETVTLTVSVNDRTYTASGAQFTDYPTITSPAPSASWSAGNSHTLTWSGGAPLPGSGGAYAIAVLDANDPGGDLIWPSDNYLRELALGVTSNIIPANIMPLGDRLALVGISQETIVSDYSSYYIDLYVTGMNYAPFTVIPSPTPTNVSATPGDTQISLSWTPVDNAQSYNIYWSTTAANANKTSGTPISGVSGTAFSFTGLANGTPYYCVVTAVTSTGVESLASAPYVAAIPGTTLMGGSVLGRPLVLANTVVPLAGDQVDSGYADCAGATARFSGPHGITTDGANLYLADTNNHTIRKIVISNGEVTTLAGKAGYSGSDDGVGPAARFNGPFGITTDGTNLYVADSLDHTIRKIVISTGAVTTLAGSAGHSGSTNGTGSAARFNGPQGVTTDGTDLYVADSSNHTIRKIAISTGTVTTLAGTAGASGFDNGDGPTARFYYPYGITTDGSNLYVAEPWSSTIRKIVVSTATVTTLAGTPFSYGSVDATGADARFARPWCLTTDGTSLYLTDWAVSSIRKIVITDGATTTLPSVSFSHAGDITTDGINLYVADANGIAGIR